MFMLEKLKSDLYEFKNSAREKHDSRYFYKLKTVQKIDDKTKKRMV